DSLTILEKDDSLKTAIETNTNATLQIFLNSLSTQVCANLTIFTPTQSQIISAQKAGCTQSNESSTAKRTFIANNTNIYYADMVSWYR
ncbi:hypothetical protein ACFLYT_01140, partial [Nanoarchaeota archaeon]